MTYEVEWHRVSKELPAPYANCYFTVQAEPNDLQLTVAMGYYDEAADVFVEDSTNTIIPVKNVWCWTAQIIPEINEVKR